MINLLTQRDLPPSLEHSSFDMLRRMRRNRKSTAVRALVQENHLQASQLVAPFFVMDGEKQRVEIASLPEVYRFSVDELLKELESYVKVGIQAINLFCYTPSEKKDPYGTEGYRKDNLLQTSIRAIKQAFPQLVVMADIALDPYTDHGHDGVVGQNGEIINDESIVALKEMALRAAEAGCDVISPSDMMDGRVLHMRKALDGAGFHNVSILSYAAKYASCFYGPFRDALDSTPKFGDKKSYQLNPANVREALLECLLDEQEGADMLLIKPGLSNLDVIAKVRAQTHLPVGAYQVSGEYAMIKLAAANKLLKEDQAFLETHLCMRRAGCDFIFTYAAKKVASLLQ